MPTTYEPIATTTLGSAASTITFSSIPATYTDLVLVVTYLGDGGSTYPFYRINGTASQNVCSQTRLIGNGSSATSSRLTNADLYFGNVEATATIPATEIAHFFSYAGSTRKTALYESLADKNGSGKVERGVALIPITAAINSIVMNAVVSNFAAGTTATLYGILKA